MFWFSSPWWIVKSTIFSYICFPIICHIWRNVCASPQPFFYWNIKTFLLLNCRSSVYILKNMCVCVYIYNGFPPKVVCMYIYTHTHTYTHIHTHTHTHTHIYTYIHISPISSVLLREPWLIQCLLYARHLRAIGIQ